MDRGSEATEEFCVSPAGEKMLSQLRSKSNSELDTIIQDVLHGDRTFPECTPLESEAIARAAAGERGQKMEKSIRRNWIGGITILVVIGVLWVAELVLGAVIQGQS